MNNPMTTNFFRGLIKKFYYNKKEILNIKKINSFLNKKKLSI
jgi:hypothetical protein